MSLEATITDAVRASSNGLTRDELLAKARHYDTDQNIMRMASKMLAGGRLEYSTSGRYSCPVPKAQAQAPVGGSRRQATRERILACIGTGQRTTKEIMAGCDLSEMTVGSHLRELIADGEVDRLQNPANRKAPLYSRPNTAAANNRPHLQDPLLNAVWAAAANVQAALDQFNAALAEYQAGTMPTQTP